MPFSVIQKCPKNKKNVRKFLSNFGKITDNAIFSHTKMSKKIKKCQKIFKLFWKNDRNVSTKTNLGFNSLCD